MGWFDGDAANLEPIHDDEVAGWITEELGGRPEIMARVEKYAKSGELRRALWLCQMVQADAPGGRDARLAKADVLERLAEGSHNPLIKNWQLSEAALLRGRVQPPTRPKITGATIVELPIKEILRLLPSRLHPKHSARVEMAIGFDITDSGEQYTLFIRHGVGELSTGLSESSSLTLRATEQDLKRIFIAREVTPASREFWQRIEFSVPEAGVLSRFQKLLRLVRMRRLFIKA